VTGELAGPTGDRLDRVRDYEHQWRRAYLALRHRRVPSTVLPPKRSTPTSPQLGSAKPRKPPNEGANAGEAVEHDDQERAVAAIGEVLAGDGGEESARFDVFEDWSLSRADDAARGRLRRCWPRGHLADDKEVEEHAQCRQVLLDASCASAAGELLSPHSFCAGVPLGFIPPSPVYTGFCRVSMSFLSCCAPVWYSSGK
jgi:hypothetical protein